MQQMMVESVEVGEDRREQQDRQGAVLREIQETQEKQQESLQELIEDHQKKQQEY